MTLHIESDKVNNWFSNDMQTTKSLKQNDHRICIGIPQWHLQNRWKKAQYKKDLLILLASEFLSPIHWCNVTGSGSDIIIHEVPGCGYINQTYWVKLLAFVKGISH